MNTIINPPTARPRPQERITCPNDGTPTRSAWRHDHRGVLREYLVCAHCQGVVCVLPSANVRT